MGSGVKAACKIADANVKKPCKPKKSPNKTGVDVSAGVSAAHTNKDGGSQTYGAFDLKFRAFRRISSGKASLGAQFQGFHSPFRFTKSTGASDPKTISGFSVGPYLDAQLTKSVPLRLVLSPQIGAAIQGNKKPLLYLGINIGLKIFVTKRLFLEGQFNLGSVVEEGSGTDVYNGSQSTLDDNSKGFLFVSGGLSFGVTIY